jgi:hypothetical protein
MSGHEEAVYEEAKSVFNDVKKFFTYMNGSVYESVQRMVVHLRECMQLLYWEDGETADSGWSTYMKEYMETVTGILNECYAEYEKENSCDLDFYWYVAFVDLLDKCRSWMRKLIEEDPESEVVAGMELGPVRRVTKTEYEGRRGVWAESGAGKERSMRETIEDLRNEVSELRNRIDKLERAKVERRGFRWWGKTDAKNDPSRGVHAADIQTLLCRLSEMNLERASKDTLRLEI